MIKYNSDRVPTIAVPTRRGLRLGNEASGVSRARRSSLRPSSREKSTMEYLSEASDPSDGVRLCMMDVEWKQRRGGGLDITANVRS